MKQFLRILSGGVGLLTLGMLIVVLIFTLKPFEGKTPTTFQSPIQSPTPFVESTLQPEATFTPVGGIFDSPLPGPTKTPMPELTEVKLVDIRPLTFDDTTPTGQELRALMNLPVDWSHKTNGAFNAAGWINEVELVVQSIIPNTKKDERPFWALNIHNGQVRPLPDQKFQPELGQVEQKILTDFLATWQGKPERVRPYSSPTGKYLALVAPQDIDEPLINKLYIYSVEKPDTIIGVAYGVTNASPLWSPDGSKVAYEVIIVNKTGFPNESSELHHIDLTTGEVSEIGPVYYESYPTAVSWSPDGEYIAFTAQRGDHEPLSLFVVKADRTGLVNLTPNSQYWVIDFLFWSPDENYVVFGVSGSDIWIAEIQIDKVASN